MRDARAPTRYARDVRLLTFVLLALSSAGCQPTFEPAGALTIGGAAFAPVGCQVLAPRATGIDLRDAQGRSLSLTLPPQILDAWRKIHGTPRATLALPGQPPQELGPCGALMLEGEGYHGQGKRAASGSATLQCGTGETAVHGTLTFDGCF